MLEGKQIWSRNANRLRHTIQSEAAVLTANSHATNFIPAGDVIAELEGRASEYAAEANQSPGPEARAFRELAELCRGWVMSLRYGNWTS